MVKNSRWSFTGNFLDKLAIIEGVVDMRRIGVIVRADGPTARVKMEKGTSCGERNCPLSSSWIDDSRSDFYVVEAQNHIGASVGDRVLVELPDLTALSVAFLLYLFPIVVALVVYLVLRLLVHSSIFLLFGVLGGVCFSMMLIRRFDRSFSPDYRIVELLDVESCHLCPLLHKEVPDSFDGSPDR